MDFLHTNKVSSSILMECPGKNAFLHTNTKLEETDAAVDLRIKNSVCLVIDLEGFFVGRIFQELGYYSWNEHFGRHAFFQPAALKDLSHKDKKDSELWKT